MAILDQIMPFLVWILTPQTSLLVKTVNLLDVGLRKAVAAALRVSAVGFRA
jgi:hypothetical protein